MLVVATALALSSTPSDAAASATNVRPIVTGWLPYWQPVTATDTVTANADLFREASPFIWSVTSATNVNLQLSSTSVHSMVSALHAHGIKVIPTFTTTMNADSFATLLRSRAKRLEQVNALVRAATAYGVDGVDLDYENINFGSSAARATVKNTYPILVHALQRALSAHGMTTAVTVPARTSDTDPNWAVYDYARLGASADLFRIMTYDYHWSGGPPGAMAPRGWVNRVLAYAVTRVPSSKISFGLPSYGRDWFDGTVSGKCPAGAHVTTSGTSAYFTAFAAARGIAMHWNRAGSSRTFTYRKRYTSGSTSCVARRVVWFDDAGSFRVKLPLVARYHLRGVAIWALGNETSSMWSTMQSYGASVAKRSVQLAIQAPGSLTYGATGTIGGTVSQSGAPVAGLGVQLQRLRSDGTWAVVARGVSGSTGHVSFPVTPQATNQYRLATPSTWRYRLSRSSGLQLPVTYRVYVGATSQRLSSSARTYQLGGHVNPGTSGTNVMLQLSRNGHWVTRASSSTSAGGRYTLSVTIMHSGTRLVRVLAGPGGSLARGTSSVVKATFN